MSMDKCPTCAETQEMAEKALKELRYAKESLELYRGMVSASQRGNAHPWSEADVAIARLNMTLPVLLASIKAGEKE